eukprot:jgi/Chrzof1/13949/Cz08g19030.t1
MEATALPRSADVSLNMKPTGLQPSMDWFADLTKIFAPGCVSSKQPFLLRHYMTVNQSIDLDNKHYTVKDTNGQYRIKMAIRTVTSYVISGQIYYTALYYGRVMGKSESYYPYTSYFPSHGSALPDVARKMNHTRSLGWSCSGINAVTVSNQNYYTAWWEKNTGSSLRDTTDYRVDYDITGIDSFMNKHNEHVKAGCRASWVTGFGSTEHKFATIWKKQSAGQVKVNLKAADLTKEIDKYLAQGWHPVLINGYAIKGTSWYVAIFEPVGKDAKNTARFGMTESEYKSYQDQQICAGYTAVHISVWTETQDKGREGLRYAAIWRK